MKTLDNWEKELIKLGYRRYQHHKQEVDAFYQRAVYGKNGEKLYFLNVELYDFNQFGRNKVSAAMESNLYLYKDDSAGFVVSRSIENGDIESTEKFFKNVYDELNCVPDIHNN